MRLRRSDPAAPGIRRHRHGSDVGYVHDAGEAIDVADADRITSLAIPPAWMQVWICPFHNGHIQAVGTDAAGRRQYLYHPAWHRSRAAARHHRMLRLAERLPTVRHACAISLRGSELSQERVLAGAFRLLDRHSLRVGSETYAAEHETYGLASLLRDHARIDGSHVTLEFVGKSGADLRFDLVDASTARLVTDLLDRADSSPGLFAWSEDGTWHHVRSSHINAFIKQHLGDEFSAKDFRTWNATVLMAQSLSLLPTPTSASDRRDAIAHSYAVVADYLGNTPTVTRSSYVNPRIVDLYGDGITVPARALPRRQRHLPVHPRVERAVLRILRAAEGAQQGR